MPPGLSPVHLVVIFVVALIVLGPESLPEVARKGAILLGEARQWRSRISQELQDMVSLPSQDPATARPETRADGVDG